MRLRDHVAQVAQRGERSELEELVAREPRAVRHLLGLTYHADGSLRAAAAQALGLAARHHTKQLQQVVRRLVWAMNDESGTHALTAPSVLQAIARECPEIVIPVAPDLMRLLEDPGLRPGLVQVLQTLTRSCPGEVGSTLTRDLNERLKQGDANG